MAESGRIEIDWRKVNYYAVTGRGEVNAEERACAIHKQVEDAALQVENGLNTLLDISETHIGLQPLNEILANKIGASDTLCELIHSLLSGKGLPYYRQTKERKIQL